MKYFTTVQFLADLMRWGARQRQLSRKSEQSFKYVGVPVKEQVFQRLEIRHLEMFFDNKSHVFGRGNSAGEPHVSG